MKSANIMYNDEIFPCVFDKVFLLHLTCWPWDTTRLVHRRLYSTDILFFFFFATCFAFYGWSHCWALFKVDNGNSSPQLNAFSFGKLTTYTPKVLPTKFAKKLASTCSRTFRANKVAQPPKREGVGCGSCCCLRKIWKIDWGKQKKKGREELEEPCELFNFMRRRCCCCIWNLCLQLARKNKNCIFMTQGTLFVFCFSFFFFVCNQIKYCFNVFTGCGGGEVSLICQTSAT